MIQLNTGSQVPIFQQIVDGICYKIATCELPPGAKLPSVRSLAALLTINSKTVAKAYGILTEKGLVEARSGLGLFVSLPLTSDVPADRQAQLQQAIDSFIANTTGLNYSHHELVQALQQTFERIEKHNASAAQGQRL